MRGVLAVFGAVGLVVGIAAAIVDFAEMPIVHKSWATGECIHVDDPNGIHHCGHLPSRYRNEWIA